MGKQVFFVTNNGGISRKFFSDKMVSLGFDPVDERNLYPASTLAGLYVRKNLPDHPKVWCFGSRELREELESLGLICEGIGPNFGNDLKYIDIETWEVDPDIKAVIGGYDKAFDLSKMAVASLYL